MDLRELENCTLCPRNCKVNRCSGNRGYCGQNAELMVARAALHMWEEPCISGNRGSGTVFFSGCSVKCVFCQNHNIAAGKAGKRITIDRLADIFLELQDKDANNINLVTPTHYGLHIGEAIIKAKKLGLELPIVYNSSGYESVEALKRLDGLIDVYLPDFKYMDSNLGKKYSNIVDYASYAKASLREMVRQVGEPVFSSEATNRVEEGIMTRGVIVRHLVLPGCVEDSKKIIQYLFETYKDSIFISIMNQYTPLQQVELIPELNRKLTSEEYDQVVDFAIDLGVENGFIQEGETASESFIPEFNNEGV